jgi:hypothetical protein
VETNSQADRDISCTKYKYLVVQLHNSKRKNLTRKERKKE